MLEHDFEPIPGLPDELPAGEVILWQGAPQRRSLARFAFHERKFVVYFAVLLAWYAGAAFSRLPASEAGLGLLQFTLLAGIVIGVLEVLSWLVARTTLYTVTNRRVVMRVGIALSMTINLPFRLIESAGMKANADGTGDLLLTLKPEESVSYMMLWPHVRPWHFFHPKPLLRAVPDVARAAGILARALAKANGQPVGVLHGERIAKSRPDAAVTA